MDQVVRLEIVWRIKCARPAPRFGQIHPLAVAKRDSDGESDSDIPLIDQAGESELGLRFSAVMAEVASS